MNRLPGHNSRCPQLLVRRGSRGFRRGRTLGEFRYPWVSASPHETRCFEPVEGRVTRNS
jgi:hypothetical protein